MYRKMGHSHSHSLWQPAVLEKCAEVAVARGLKPLRIGDAIVFWVEGCPENCSIRFILMGELNKSITQETNLEITNWVYWRGVRPYFGDEHPSLKLELEYL